MVLGGGHEVAFGSWTGLARHMETRSAAPRIGIVNFDAHFDLRNPAFVTSSGTPFAQIAAASAARGWPFRYAYLGVSRAANTVNLFDRAQALGVHYRLDRDLSLGQLPEIDRDLDRFLAGEIDCRRAAPI